MRAEHQLEMSSVSRQGKYHCQHATANSNRTIDASGHGFMAHQLEDSLEILKRGQMHEDKILYSYTFCLCDLIGNSSVTSFVPRGHVDWRIFSLSLTLNS